jgi:hypothetical protein
MILAAIVAGVCVNIKVCWCVCVCVCVTVYVCVCVLFGCLCVSVYRYVGICSSGISRLCMCVYVFLCIVKCTRHSYIACVSVQESFHPLLRAPFLRALPFCRIHVHRISPSLISGRTDMGTGTVVLPDLLIAER